MRRCSRHLFTFLIVALLSLALMRTPGFAQEPEPKKAAAATDQASKTEEAKGELKPLERDDEYYELLTLFADTLDQIDRNYVKDISRRELMEAAIKGMVKELDQYSNYISPKDIERFKGVVESEFGGVGIQVSIENEQLKVISPIVGSPAYRAGMVAGDLIIKIENTPTKGITLDDAVRLMKGKIGTEVTVTVVHPDDPMPKEIKLKRDKIRVLTVLGDRRKDDDSWNFIFDEKKKTGFIRVTSFSRHTVNELREALKELESQDVRGLILDLRFNPGGLLSAAIDVCDMFIPEGRIVSTEGRNAPKRVWDAHKKGTFSQFPIVVLVNRSSASASEIVSACLQDHERAVIVGTRTWGKGSVQNIIDLESGRSALKLTTAGYMRPSGKNIHRFDGATEKDEWGVTPNEGFVVKLTDREVTALLRDRRDRDIVDKMDPKTDPEAESAKPFTDRQLKAAVEQLDKMIHAMSDNAKDDSVAEKAKDAPAKQD